MSNLKTFWYCTREYGTFWSQNKQLIVKAASHEMAVNKLKTFITKEVRLSDSEGFDNQGSYILPDMDVVNTLIAGFMGLTVIKKENVTENTNVNKFSVIEDLRYHCSWDWLMPVCDQIINMTEIIEDFQQEQYEMIDVIQDNLIRVELRRVYRACIDFIKWHNEHKK